MNAKRHHRQFRCLFMPCGSPTRLGRDFELWQSVVASLEANEKGITVVPPPCIWMGESEHLCTNRLQLATVRIVFLMQTLHSSHPCAPGNLQISGSTGPQVHSSLEVQPFHFVLIQQRPHAGKCTKDSCLVISHIYCYPGLASALGKCLIQLTS